MLEPIQSRGLKTLGSQQIDERSYEIHGRLAAHTHSSGADSIVHQYDSTV